MYKRIRKAPGPMKRRAGSIARRAPGHSGRGRSSPGGRDAVNALADQTDRALWEVRNVLTCIPDGLWSRPYCGAPLWQHVYHMLHSLDRWFINPRDPAFQEPPFHTPNLNNLDVPADAALSRETLLCYLDAVERRVRAYLAGLTPEMLAQRPDGCEWSRLTLIVAQHRHLHTHMGMLMGFLIADCGLWPRVLGLEGEKPEGEYGLFC